MGEPDERSLAEWEYQRRLADLHRARAELTEIEAALRRLGIDRAQLAEAVFSARLDELRSRRTQLAAQVDALHDRASEQRRAVRALGGTVEPEVPPELPTGGIFEQPPFGGQ